MSPHFAPRAAPRAARPAARARLARAALPLLASCALAARASAQRVDVEVRTVGAPRPGDSAAPVAAALTLGDVVRRAIEDGPDVRTSALAVDAARGASLAAQAAFDAQLQAGVANNRTNNLTWSESLVSALSTSETYSLGARKRLQHGGVTLAPQLSVNRVGTPDTPALPQSRALAAVAATVPLARDRGGSLARAAGDVAGLELRATESDLGYAAASGVYQTLTAYWGYVAARRRLDVYRGTEERAASMIERTTALVAADERTPADLTQLRGNYASKRAQRIGAEQAVVEAWLQLAQRLALPPANVATPPATTSDFPRVAPGLDSVDIRPIVARALAARQDFHAVGARAAGARRNAAAAAGASRPQVDVVVQVGYSGLVRGGGMNPLLQPFYRNTSGMNASVQLQVSRPLGNVDARGQAARADAALASTALAQRETERRVQMGVAVAVEAVRQAARVLAEAQRALGIVREAVTNEQRRFQLGSSTAFDIVLAEDNLTSALLAEANAQQTYAAGLARLHHEAGTLVQRRAGVLSADPARILRLPDAP
jgi:outer membrane protein TolC